jgi:hypothetical protein
MKREKGHFFKKQRKHVENEEFPPEKKELFTVKKELFRLIFTGIE